MPPDPDLRRRPPANVPARQADSEDHHIFLFGVFFDVSIADVVASHRVIDSIGEDEDDAAAFLVQERRDAHVDGIPERRRSRLLQFGPEDLEKIVLAAGEIPRIDLDPVREAADARLVARLEQSDELLRRRPHQPEIANHASAAIEHHHERDRLDPTFK